MGGKTVMTTSLLSPDRIEKLVVVDSSPTVSNSKGEVFDYMQGMMKIDMSRMRTRKDVEKEVNKFAKVDPHFYYCILKISFPPQKFFFFQFMALNQYFPNSVWPPLVINGLKILFR